MDNIPLDKNSQVNIEFHPHNHTSGYAVYQTIGSLISQSHHNAIVCDTNHFPFFRDAENEIRRFGGANLDLKTRIENSVLSGYDRALKKYNFEYFCNDDVIKSTAKKNKKIVWLINALEYGAAQEVLIYPRMDLKEKFEDTIRDPELLEQRRKRDIIHLKEDVFPELKNVDGFYITPHPGVLPEGLNVERIIDLCESGFKPAAIASFNSRNWIPGANNEAKKVYEIINEKFDVPEVYEADSAIKNSNRAYNLINTIDFNPEIECEKKEGKYFIRNLGETISAGKVKPYKVGSGRFAGLSNPLPWIMFLSSINNVKVITSSILDKL
jgi:hypothetical protein